MAKQREKEVTERREDENGEFEGFDVCVNGLLVLQRIWGIYRSVNERRRRRLFDLHFF